MYNFYILFFLLPNYELLIIKYLKFIIILIKMNNESTIII